MQLLGRLVLVWVWVFGPCAGMAQALENSERGVYSRTWIVHAPDAEEEIASAETAAGGRFDEAESTSAMLSPSTGTVTSALDSNVALRGARALGTVQSNLNIPETDRRAAAIGDSFFEVQFDAVEGDPYDLRGEVSAAASGADAFASVEIVELNTGAIVFESQASAGEQSSFDEQGVLTAGRYRLTALALSAGETAGAASPQPSALASFEVVVFVPEPAFKFAARFAALLVVGLMAMRRRVARG